MNATNIKWAKLQANLEANSQKLWSLYEMERTGGEPQEIVYPPGSPSDGVRAAMILVDGAPVELIWFRRANNSED